MLSAPFDIGSIIRDIITPGTDFRPPSFSDSEPPPFLPSFPVRGMEPRAPGFGAAELAAVLASARPTVDVATPESVDVEAVAAGLAALDLPDVPGAVLGQTLELPPGEVFVDDVSPEAGGAADEPLQPSTESEGTAGIPGDFAPIFLPDPEPEVSIIGDIISGVGGALGGIFAPTSSTPPFQDFPTGGLGGTLGTLLGGVLIDKAGFGLDNPFTEVSPVPGIFDGGFDDANIPVIGPTVDAITDFIGGDDVAAVPMINQKLPDLVTGNQLAVLAQQGRAGPYCFAGKDSSGQLIFRKKRSRRKNPLTKQMKDAILFIEGTVKNPDVRKSAITALLTR